MTAHRLQFMELSDRERAGADPHDDSVELTIRQKSGADRRLSLPPEAAAAIESALDHLLRGERIAILTEDQELTPNEISSVLGISRPLVVHRMDLGDLPFRYVGKHRRAKLKDVLILQEKIDAGRAVMEALADDAEDLKQRHGV